MWKVPSTSTPSRMSPYFRIWTCDWTIIQRFTDDPVHDPSVMVYWQVDLGHMKHQICSNTGSSLFPCRMDFYQTHLWQIEFDSKRWPWWWSRCVQSSIRHIFIHVSQWFVYNTDITVRQVYFLTVRLLNLSRSLCFLFRVLCSSDGGLPFGRCHRWIHLGRTGCPCLRYVQIASCLISEMCDMFFSLALHFPCEFVWTLSS